MLINSEINKLQQYLALEESGEPFANKDLEDRRQQYINFIVCEIIDAQARLLEEFRQSQKLKKAK